MRNDYVFLSTDWRYDSEFSLVLNIDAQETLNLALLLFIHKSAEHNAFAPTLYEAAIFIQIFHDCAPCRESSEGFLYSARPFFLCRGNYFRIQTRYAEHLSSFG